MSARALHACSKADLPTLVDINTVASHLGVSVRHIRRLVDERRIPFVKVGRFVRFDIDDIARWVDAHRTDTLDRASKRPVGAKQLPVG